MNSLTKRVRVWGVLLAVLLCVVSMGTTIYATTYDFSAEMDLRMVDGKKNNITYDIGKDIFVVFKGSVSSSNYSSADHEGTVLGELCGTQKTYVNLCETDWLGRRKTICGTTVSVDGVNKRETFLCTGNTEEKSKKYVYIYKPLNDGWNLDIDGEIIH